MKRYEEIKRFEEIKSNSKLNSVETLAQIEKNNELEFWKKKPMHEDDRKTAVIMVGSFFTVIFCCIMSQVFVTLSKTTNLTLNKFYSKKKYEKAKMIQSFMY